MNENRTSLTIPPSRTNPPADATPVASSSAHSHHADAAVTYLADTPLPYTVIYQGSTLSGSPIDALELWTCLTQVLTEAGLLNDRPPADTRGDYAREVDNWRRWNDHALATAYDRAQAAGSGRAS
jgi:hypothetical protein